MTVGEALFSYQGRMCRSDYWLKGFLPLLPVGILSNILMYGVGGDAQAISFIIGLASLWPGSALAVKRLHDRDHSAHFLWVMLIPFIGPIWFLVECWFLEGTTGPNRYGADPLRPSFESFNSAGVAGEAGRRVVLVSPLAGCRIRTTDNAVRILQAHDLNSTVVAELPGGTEVQLGAASEIDGREWLEATLQDGSSGYVLGPIARGHSLTIAAQSSSAL